MLYDTSKNNREKWINEIKTITGETDTANVIQFCLSYTLQSLRHNKKEVSLDDIRAKYGSQTVKNQAYQYSIS